MTIKHPGSRILSNRGSSMIMALVTITVLVVLGLCVITITMGNLNANAADAMTNDSYYAAESGVGNALDQLKMEVSRYYNSMLSVQGSAYTNLYTNFASNISANAQTNFKEPAITGGTTKTTFSVAGHDSNGDVYEFLATTTATMADGTKYQVEARLKVKRVDVSAKSWFVDMGALVVGGTLTVNTSSGIEINNNDAVLGALVHHYDWDFKVKNGQLIIDPTVKDSINDVLDYPSFSDPVISNPSYYITQSNTYIDNSYSKLHTQPALLDTADNVNVFFTDSNVIPDGIIRVRGDLTMNNGGNIYSDIYCRNLIENGRAIYGDIYAHGNVTIQGGDIYGNIYCDGSVTLSSISVHGSVISNGNVTINGATALGNLFASGTINLSHLSASGNVIYSKTKIVTSSTLSAIVFSGGDIEFVSGSGSVNGVVIAKNNVTLSNAWPSITYNADDVAEKLAAIKGTFFDSGGGGSAAALDSSVFQGQSITALGRIN
jgi:cytoskeletal protein CcmA (bactofilin family)